MTLKTYDARLKPIGWIGWKEKELWRFEWSDLNHFFTTIWPCHFAGMLFLRKQTHAKDQKTEILRSKRQYQLLGTLFSFIRDTTCALHIAASYVICAKWYAKLVLHTQTHFRWVFRKGNLLINIHFSTRWAMGDGLVRVFMTRSVPTELSTLLGTSTPYRMNVKTFKLNNNPKQLCAKETKRKKKRMNSRRRKKRKKNMLMVFLACYCHSVHGHIAYTYYFLFFSFADVDCESRERERKKEESFEPTAAQRSQSGFGFVYISLFIILFIFS